MALKALKTFLAVVLAGTMAFACSSCRKKPEPDIPEEPSERVQSVSAAVKGESEQESKKAIKTNSKLEWMTDFEAAKKKAVAENKDLFLKFIGSDWCPLCERLDKEVFSKKAFIEYVQKTFVLIELDFPNNKSLLSAETQRQNQKLGAEFGARRFPMIILADKEGVPFAKSFPTIILTGKGGVPFAQTRYVEGWAEKYVEHLKEFQAVKKEVNELIIKSEDTKIESTKRAALLESALEKLPGWVVDKYYVDKMKRITELDAENKGGLKNKYLIRIDFIAVQQALQQRNYDEALQKITAMIAQFKPTGQLAQELYFAKAHAQYFLKDSEGEKESLQKALEAAPDGFLAEQIKTNLRRF